MRIAFFSSQLYDEQFFNTANQSYQYEFVFFHAHLNKQTVIMAKDFPIVCCFVNDHLTAEVIKQLHAQGTRLIALRCAGFNQVDLTQAKACGMTVVRVPEYSPYAVAEHAVGLILTLNRKIYRAYYRVREHNFSLQGLMGFDLHNACVGVIGLGKIGRIFAKIMLGFGCQVWGNDLQFPAECTQWGVRQASLDEIYQNCQIISLHCPLTEATFHLINQQAVEQMRPGVMLINTSRGGLIDTKAIIDGLKKRHIGSVGLDVYEEEGHLFFEDLSDEIIQDDVFARLQTFPNVLITAHQAFFTEQAMHNIAQTTLENIHAFLTGKGHLHAVHL
ncbi:MAG: 2-hydroxyacid dehydrogenase [Legionellales bacterium]|nr:2-hydroxyacid dehydrogenase [Legionellales bacterium]